VLRSARPRKCHRGSAVIYSRNASRLIWQEPLGGEHSWSISSQRMLNFKCLKSLSAILDDRFKRELDVGLSPQSRQFAR
jgi:hypothetical protein